MYWKWFLDPTRYISYFQFYFFTKNSYKLQTKVSRFVASTILWLRAKAARAAMYSKWVQIADVIFRLQQHFHRFDYQRNGFLFLLIAIAQVEQLQYVDGHSGRSQYVIDQSTQTHHRLRICETPRSMHDRVIVCLLFLYSCILCSRRISYKRWCRLLLHSK